MPRRRKRAELRVYFEDEAPAIGSGWRGVDVLALGCKWVRVRAHASGRTARLARAIWEGLRREEGSHA